MDKIGYFSQSDLGRLGGGCVIDRLPTAFVADKINDGMTKAAEQAVKLGNDEDKAKARAAYK